MPTETATPDQSDPKVITKSCLYSFQQAIRLVEKVLIFLLDWGNRKRNVEELEKRVYTLACAYLGSRHILIPPSPSTDMEHCCTASIPF